MNEPTLTALAVHSENVLSGIVLIALLTYFYSAFGKVLQTGGEQGGCSLKQRGLDGSRFYYSSPAAV